MLRMTARWQTVPHWFEAISTVRVTHFRRALSLLGFLLTPVAVLAGGLGAWRFGADAGWTNTFFIADGLLSHWQIWCAFAISAQACALSLNRGVADREPRMAALISVNLCQVEERTAHYGETGTEETLRVASSRALEASEEIIEKPGATGQPPRGSARDAGVRPPRGTTASDEPCSSLSATAHRHLTACGRRPQRNPGLSSVLAYAPGRPAKCASAGRGFQHASILNSERIRTERRFDRSSRSAS